METVNQLLRRKGGQVWTIRIDETVLDAINAMAEKDIGALVVIENGKPVGMFTERHYARNVFLKGRHSPTTSIRDVMSAPVVCASPGQTVDQCMAVMTEKRIRHLPVMEKGKLTGMVSIGDLVKSKIEKQEFVIDQLVHYIQG